MKQAEDKKPLLPKQEKNWFEKWREEILDKNNIKEEYIDEIFLGL